VKTQVRILFLAAALALLAGLYGLRRGNVALAARIAAEPSSEPAEAR
jgi:hypothetical protein